MTVNRYHLRIFHMGHEKAQWETELDPADEVRLRELLVAAAEQHNPTNRVRDYGEWRLEVSRIALARPDHRGPRVAMVTVDGAGRTVVRR